MHKEGGNASDSLLPSGGLSEQLSMYGITLMPLVITVDRDVCMYSLNTLSARDAGG